MKYGGRNSAISNPHLHLFRRAGRGERRSSKAWLFGFRFLSNKTNLSPCHHIIFLQVRHTVSVLIDEKESTDTEESGIKDIVVQISWPLKTAAGKYLLYLSEVCDNF